MELNAFLQSGLLEAYALGEVSKQERALVERMLAEYPEAKAELDAIEQALENIAHAHAVPPPPGLKAQIMAQLGDTPPPASAAPSAAKPNILQWLSIVFLLAAAYFFFQNRALTRENAAQAQRLAECDAQNAQRNQLYALLRDPNTKVLQLQNGNDLVRVFHNTQRCQTAFDVSQLASRTDGKHYQLWALTDKKIESLGMARDQLTTSDGWKLVSCIDSTHTFAISAESSPQPAATPTLPPVMAATVE